AGPTAALAAGVAAFGPAVLQIAGPVAQLIAARGLQAAAATTAAGAETAAGAATTRGAIATVASTTASIAASTASKVWAAAQWVLNAALSANPIGLVVIAIAGLVAGIVLAWKHSETFRDIVIGAWGAVRDAAVAVFDRIKTVVVGAFNGIIGFFRKYTLPGIIISHWEQIKSAVSGGVDAVVGFVTKLPRRIGKAASGAFDGITGALRTALNAVISLWNKLDFKIKISLPDKIAGIPIPGGGASWSSPDLFPDIGYLANGTDYWRGGWSWVGERGPELLNLPRGASVTPNHELGMSSLDMESAIHRGTSRALADLPVLRVPKDDVDDLLYGTAS
ncbi:MAG: hypothetical protein QM662_18630, partial [Gordonia sp. (in: high G+C Gram-positive bacteria)]